MCMSFNNDTLHRLIPALVWEGLGMRLTIARAHIKLTWLSVQVKRAFKILHRPKILRCMWETSFGEMLVATYPTLSTQAISKILINKIDRFRDPPEVKHRCSCVMYICYQLPVVSKFVCYELEEEKSIAGNARYLGNAFDVLMCREREVALQPKSSPLEGRSLCRD